MLANQTRALVIYDLRVWGSLRQSAMPDIRL
jgi:hypothetical protein